MEGFDAANFQYLGPEILLASSGLALLVWCTIGREEGKNRVSVMWAFISLIAAAFYATYIHADAAKPESILAGSFVLDGFAWVWKIVILVATAITVLLSQRFVEDSNYRPGEFYALLMYAATGMMFMVGGFNLIAIWIGLELMALSSYVLAGYFKQELKSNEAALKYFVLGALSSGIMLYGMSLLYGGTGSVRLDEIAAASPSGEPGYLISIGWVMMAVGLLFKVAAVPFHVWTPDVYVGAPTPITAFLAVASKTASFAILVRIFYQGIPGLAEDWQMVVATVAIVTMVWGNLAALTQTNVKRLLAYSSIAHAGYVLVGVLAINEIGMWAIVYYLLAYSFITLGTFGTVILLERKDYAGETCDDYAGLAGRSPFLAAMMLVFMLALTGIPPTGGFVGKFYLFAAAIEAGWTWVAVIGVLMSAVSLYYYFRIVVYMYQKDETESTPKPLREPVLQGAILICFLLTMALGLYPAPFIEFAKAAMLPLP
ncbi:MAG: NADH-quinone oxidoreductase subunit N [Acidobacteriota bacterium]|nr:NADH-quinone oxidoreductase subunit N [Acidobacteriota bacterium]